MSDLIYKDHVKALKTHLVVVVGVGVKSALYFAKGDLSESWLSSSL